MIINHHSHYNPNLNLKPPTPKKVYKRGERREERGEREENGINFCLPFLYTWISFPSPLAQPSGRINTPKKTNSIHSQRAGEDFSVFPILFSVRGRISWKMIAGFIAKSLLLFFGYAYPAFECFKALENKRSSNHQLRFWCQYWIIVGIVTVAEVLISWMPMYDEVKLAFFLYLWYPKTKGSYLVYDAFLRPFIMQYEPNIEERFRNLRAKSGDLLVFYLMNFTERGYQLFLEVLRYLTSSEKGKRSSSSGQKWWSRKNPSRGALRYKDDIFAQALQFGTQVKPRRSRRYQ